MGIAKTQLGNDTQASKVTSQPVGTIAATNVQDAIDEMQAAISAGLVTFADIAQTRTGTSTTLSVNPAGLAAFNGPRFKVTQTGAQNTTSLTWTKARLNVVQYDTDDDYDHVTNFRFIPSTPGWYSVSIAGSVACGANVTTGIAIYRNGLQGRTFTDIPSASGYLAFQGLDKFEMNGTTDFFEMYVFSSRVVTDGLSLGAFESHRISPL